MKVGFIGLGDIGGAMALSILRAGHELVLWARRPDALAPFVAAGATATDSAADLAAQVDFLGLCVFDDADVVDVLQSQNALAAMQSGSMLLLHSTISRETATAMEAAANEYGVAMLDAPVTGGRAAAEAGRLLTIVGGDAANVREAEPVLRSFSDRIVRTGPVGSAQLAKLVNNLLFAANASLAMSALRLGRELGLDEEALDAVLAGGSGKSVGLEAVLSGLLHRDDVDVAWLLRKDIKHAAALGTWVGGAPIGQAAFDLLEALGSTADVGPG